MTSAYRFSANTGFLWKELPFLDRIRRAAAHGFDAVEFHDEAQRENREALKDVLAETGLPVVGLNVRMGETAGYAARPEATEAARSGILEAAETALHVGAGSVHVLAGKAEGADAARAYVDTLRFALAETDLTILIEPICAEQVPGYFLSTIEQAAGVIAEISNRRLKIMFDCYHVQRESGALMNAFVTHAGHIGHVQIAAMENRAEPFPGELDYGVLLPEFRKAGYDGPFGCEYRPKGRTEDGLAWRDTVMPARGE